MKTNKHTYIAIMAGGVGSRFWPSSTEQNPKQFLDILGTGKSLLRITFERYLELVPKEQIYFVTHINYREKIKEHIPEIGYDQIICEPSRNNTAPGVAYAAMKIHKKDPNAVMIMAPSDHIILKESIFLNKLKLAIQFAEENEALITLGILPTRPDTGYGYIQFEEGNGENPIKKVIEFKEKPDLPTANQYLESGLYLWNSGMFIWKSRVILDAFKSYAGELYDVLSKGESVYNTEMEWSFIEEYFPQTPSISVDYAIMENAENIYTIPADIGWSDLGTWNALHAFLDKDNEGNVVNNQKSVLLNSSNNMIKLPGDKIVVVKDLDDYMIIDEKEVLLIYPKNKEQEIREVREMVVKK